MNNYSRFAVLLGLAAFNVILMIAAFNVILMIAAHHQQSEAAFTLGAVGLVSAIVSMLIIKGEQ